MGNVVEDRCKSVMAHLLSRGWRLGTAESCTGGLIGYRLTSVSGSSRYFAGGIIAYSDDIKIKYLEVDADVLHRHGAVSEPVARQMARGVCDRAGTTWGLSTTGIAGPDGGTPEKPVGTVYIGVALAAPWGSGKSTTQVRHYEFDGDRTDIKRQIAEQALTDLRAGVESGSP